ncbi:MAG: AAA family ATPase [Candidatus Magasanikbacteria bacterium]
MGIKLGIVGKIGSGKTTAAKYLQQAHNFKTIKFSGFVRDILDRMHLQQNRDNMSKLSTSLRESFGKDIFSRVLIKESKNKDRVILEGARKQEDLSNFKDREDFYLLAISADQEIRYNRVSSRNENEDDKGKTFEEFKQDEKKATETEIASLMKLADYTISNNGTLAEFQEKLDKLIAKLNE